MERPWFAHYDPGVPHQIEIPDIPFTAIFARTVSRFPNVPAVYFYGHRWTYRKEER